MDLARTVMMPITHIDYLFDYLLIECIMIIIISPQGRLVS